MYPIQEKKSNKVWWLDSCYCSFLMIWITVIVIL